METAEIEEMRQVLERLENEIDEFDTCLSTQEESAAKFELVSRLINELTKHVSSKPDPTGLRFDTLLRGMSDLITCLQSGKTRSSISITDGVALISIAENPDFSQIQSLRKIKFEPLEKFKVNIIFLCVLLRVSDLISHDPHVTAQVTGIVHNDAQTSSLEINVGQGIHSLSGEKDMWTYKDGKLTINLSELVVCQRELEHTIYKICLGLMNRIEQCHIGIINVIAKCARKIIVEIM